MKQHILWISALLFLVPHATAEHYEPRPACPQDLQERGSIVVVDGADGFDGADGYDGEDGYDGADGYDGDGGDGQDGRPYPCDDGEIPVFPSLAAGMFAVALGAIAYIAILRR